MVRDSEEEVRRILDEYSRRDREVPSDLYAPWRTDHAMCLEERRLAAAQLLHDEGCMPTSASRIMEIGCGTAGWLPTFMDWGVPATCLAGLDLDASRLAIAARLMPGADLRQGDGQSLPWPDAMFDVVVISTVFSSILEESMRCKIAAEAVRVLSPGGAVLWYDFTVDNPRNPNVRGVGRSEIRAYFPGMTIRTRAVTLAPPVARLVAPRSRLIAALLGAIPVLRTHCVAVMRLNHT